MEKSEWLRIGGGVWVWGLKFIHTHTWGTRGTGTRARDIKRIIGVHRAKVYPRRCRFDHIFQQLIQRDLPNESSIFPHPQHTVPSSIELVTSGKSRSLIQLPALVHSLDQSGVITGVNPSLSIAIMISFASSSHLYLLTG